MLCKIHFSCQTGLHVTRQQSLCRHGKFECCDFVVHVKEHAGHLGGAGLAVLRGVAFVSCFLQIIPSLSGTNYNAPTIPAFPFSPNVL